MRVREEPGRARLRGALGEGLHAAGVGEALEQVARPSVKALCHLHAARAGPVLRTPPRCLGRLLRLQLPAARLGCATQVVAQQDTLLVPGDQNTV